jgi:hypothetical protein
MEDAAGSGDWSGSVERHVFKKQKSEMRTSTVILPPLYPRERVRSCQAEVTRNLLEELNQALAEGLPVAPQELERVQARLAKLEAG